MKVSKQGCRRHWRARAGVGNSEGSCDSPGAGQTGGWGRGGAEAVGRTEGKEGRKEGEREEIHGRERKERAVRFDEQLNVAAEAEEKGRDTWPRRDQ